MKPTDKELAALNAEMHKLCGWHYDASRRAWHRNGYWTAEPDHYTSDRAAAMEVLEKCAEKCRSPILIDKIKSQWVVWQHGHSLYKEDRAADTLALAICLFAKQLYSK